jgi:5-methylcytosine-specific restriction protein A
MSTRPSNWPTTSPASRGYGTAWRKLRVLILQRDNFICQCPECKRLDRVRLANEVNHIVSRKDAAKLGWTPEQMDDPANLQSLSKGCHARITATQKGHKPARRIGLDGFPIGDEGAQS